MPKTKTHFCLLLEGEKPGNTRTGLLSKERGTMKNNINTFLYLKQGSRRRKGDFLLLGVRRAERLTVRTMSLSLRRRYT